jgi:uncharacterized membrane protein
MNRVEKTVEIDQPVDVVYAAWSRFEDFPAFLEGVSAVERQSDGRLRWTSKDGTTVEVEVTEQVPDEVVAWRTVGDTTDSWRASLIALSLRRTRVDLEVEHEPHGIVERAADALGVLERRVEGDLARFKAHVGGTSGHDL